MNFMLKPSLLKNQHIVPSLRVAKIIDLADSGTVEERLSQLVQLEEDRFVVGFHQQVQKAREKAWHDKDIK
jgi:hypothetical protein